MCFVGPTAFPRDQSPWFHRQVVGCKDPADRSGRRSAGGEGRAGAIDRHNNAPWFRANALCVAAPKLQPASDPFRIQNRPRRPRADYFQAAAKSPQALDNLLQRPANVLRLRANGHRVPANALRPRTSALRLRESCYRSPANARQVPDHAPRFADNSHQPPADARRIPDNPPQPAADAFQVAANVHRLADHPPHPFSSCRSPRPNRPQPDDHCLLAPDNANECADNAPRAPDNWKMPRYDWRREWSIATSKIPVVRGFIPIGGTLTPLVFGSIPIGGDQIPVGIDLLTVGSGLKRVERRAVRMVWRLVNTARAGVERSPR